MISMLVDYHGRGWTCIVETLNNCFRGSSAKRAPSVDLHMDTHTNTQTHTHDVDVQMQRFKHTESVHGQGATLLQPGR